MIPLALSALFLPLLALLPSSLAMDDNGHRQRRIYQVVTDRFARSNSGTCNVADALYCGGNYQSLISRLGYIQGMGFDTVWISPIVRMVSRWCLVSCVIGVAS